jgi:hypothetical protein
MTKFNDKEFLTSIKSLERKDLYFSGSEYSWASNEELDDNYGEFVCSYDDFVDVVNDYVAGNKKSLRDLIKINGADIDDINFMVSNEGIAVCLSANLYD